MDTLNDSYAFSSSTMIDLASWDAVIALQAIQLAYDRSLWGSLSDAQWDAVENILAYLSERLQGAVGPTP